MHRLALRTLGHTSNSRLRNLSFLSLEGNCGHETFSLVVSRGTESGITHFVAISSIDPLSKENLLDEVDAFLIQHLTKLSKELHSEHT
jgi:hypothetical protein